MFEYINEKVLVKIYSFTSHEFEQKDASFCFSWNWNWNAGMRVSKTVIKTYI